MSDATQIQKPSTNHPSTKPKVKRGSHQPASPVVTIDSTGPAPEELLSVGPSSVLNPATSNVLSHELSALFQSHAASGGTGSARSAALPKFSGKNFAGVPTHSVKPATIQPKLTVGAAHDAYEEEADRAAEQVMRMPVLGSTASNGADAPGQSGHALQRTSEEEEEIQTKPLAATIRPFVQRTRPQSEDEDVQRSIEEDDEIQTKRGSAADSFETDDDLENRVNATRGSGDPLPDTIRSFMEPRFGADFSGVRLHSGGEAAELNRQVSAQAFTLGRDIYLGEGQTDVASDGGQRLLAHELTHVVQQGGAHQLQRIPKDKDELPQNTEGAQLIEATQSESASLDTGGASPTKVPAAEAAAAPSESDKAPGSPQEDGAFQAVTGQVKPVAAQEKTHTPAQVESANAQAAVPPVNKVTNQAQDRKDVPAEVPAHTKPATSVLNESDKAPGSPQEDGAFQAVTGQVKQVAAQEKTHTPAQVESANAQAAAVPPANEVTSQAQDRHVQELEQQKPGEFNAAAFKAALLARIKDIAPKTLKEADEFKGSNKLNSVKQNAKTEVAAGKKQATGPLQDNARKEPDTSGIEPKRVTPLREPPIGPPPLAIGADKAAPKPKGQSEIEVPLQQDSQSLDQQMAAAGVTEEQLDQSNEPEFQAALAAKRQAQTSATESPQTYRQQETQLIGGAQDQAQTNTTAKIDAMHGERDSVLNQVASSQGETKTADEQARATVASAIEPIYAKTKQDVEAILNDLDKSVAGMFDAGAEKARKQFEDYVDQRVKAYKKKRYGGLFGWAKWLKDKLAGMPSEVNVFYEEGRQLYIRVMDGVLDGVAAHVAAQLNAAKARIAQGRQEIQAYVAQLPGDLQQVGAEAAGDIQSKFDELEEDVNNKQQDLIDDLAQKYQDNLKEIDARIEELKAANAGLIAKAINFIKNVIVTIVSLAAMLLKILAKAAAAVPKIILHPINFLKNLIGGVKQGLHNFVANIGKHLDKGLMQWLTGTLGGAGLQLSESLDAKGIFGMILRTLGLTWQNIRERAVNILGEKAVSYLEKGFKIFQVLSTQGLSGIWEFIKDKLGDLKTMVFGAIKDMVTSKIVKEGMRLLAAVLAGPAGGFVKAIETIINIVKWFLTNGKKLMALIDAILDSILAIASGSVDAAAQKIENALAGVIPAVLSFLADLVGIGDLGGEIRKIIAKVRKPINQAIDWVLKEAKKFAGKLGIGKDDEQKRIDQAEKEGRDVMHAEFGSPGEADQNEIDSQLGQKFDQIKQKHGLTELLPVVEQNNYWAMEGKIQRKKVTNVKKRKLKNQNNCFKIESTANSAIKAGLTAKYSVVQQQPTIISAGDRYHFQWRVERTQGNPRLTQCVPGPQNDEREWTLQSAQPGTYHIQVDVLLNNQSVEKLEIETEVVGELVLPFTGRILLAESMGAVGAGDDFKWGDYHGRPFYDLPPQTLVPDLVYLLPRALLPDLVLLVDMRGTLTALAGDVGAAMMDRFENAVGGEFQHPVGSSLSQQAEDTSAFADAHQNLRDGLNSQLEHMISRCGCIDVRNFTLNSLPISFRWSLLHPKLFAPVGGTQGIQIYLTSFVANGERQSYEATIEYNMFDDFGVGTNDLYESALIAFWLLQHVRSHDYQPPRYRPFVNHIVVSKKITGFLNCQK